MALAPQPLDPAGDPPHGLLPLRLLWLAALTWPAAGGRCRCMAPLVRSAVLRRCAGPVPGGRRRHRDGPGRGGAGHRGHAGGRGQRADPPGDPGAARRAGSRRRQPSSRPPHGWLAAWVAPAVWVWRGCRTGAGWCGCGAGGVRAAAAGGAGFPEASRIDDARRARDVALAQRDSARLRPVRWPMPAPRCSRPRPRWHRPHRPWRWRRRVWRRPRCAPAGALVLARQVEPDRSCSRAQPAGAGAGRAAASGRAGGRALPEQLAVGQSATAAADAYVGRRFAARVVSIAPLVDAQRGAIEVKLAPADPPGLTLRQDTTLSVEVETARRSARWRCRSPVAARPWPRAGRRRCWRWLTAAGAAHSHAWACGRWMRSRSRPVWLPRATRWRCGSGAGAGGGGCAPGRSPPIRHAAKAASGSGGGGGPPAHQRDGALARRAMRTGSASRPASRCASARGPVADRADHGRRGGGVAVIAYISALVTGLQANTFSKTLGGQAHVDAACAPDDTVPGPAAAHAGQHRPHRYPALAQRLRSGSATGRRRCRCSNACRRWRRCRRWWPAAIGRCVARPPSRSRGHRGRPDRYDRVASAREARRPAAPAWPRRGDHRTPSWLPTRPATGRCFPSRC